MLNKSITGAALAAAMLIPGAVQAASIDRNVTVKLRVNPILLVIVTDNDSEHTANDLTSLTSTDLAQFWVISNAGYDVSAAPEFTDGAAGSLKAKFIQDADPTISLNGELFIEKSGGAVESWNATTGTVAFTEATRGIRRYGVGADFDPTDWSGAAPLPAGAPAGAADIAPEGDYTSNVTITVSND